MLKYSISDYVSSNVALRGFVYNYLTGAPKRSTDDVVLPSEAALERPPATSAAFIPYTMYTQAKPVPHTNIRALF